MADDLRAHIHALFDSALDFRRRARRSSIARPVGS